jgi:acyl-CoA thioesterase-1
MIMGVGVFNFRLLLLRQRLRLLLSRFCYFVDMRRTESIVILAVLTLSLLGCRADKTTKEAESPNSGKSVPATEAPLPAPDPPATTSNDKRPLIVCFGDSLTAGLGTEPGKSYPDYLQTDLNAKGYQYRVVNEGVSGNTTKDGVQRVDSIAAMKPAIVIIEFGGNDGLRGFRIEDSRANLDQIVGTLKATGARIVLAGITLPPNYGPDYIRQFNETYLLLAKKYNAPLIPFLLKDVYGVDGMMQPDNTHATAEGNKIVAKNLLPLVLPLLKK